MIKRVSFIILYISLALVNVCLAAQTPQVQSLSAIEPIKKDDCILILAPHPDDETIGCAGIIQEAVSKGAKVKVAYLTNGDHNQVAFIVYAKRVPFMQSEFIHMGEVRKNEAIKAMGLLGVDKKDLIFLGYPDFGTLSIFKEIWRNAKPYKSMLTRISKVPYEENFSFEAPYKGESILSDIEKVLKEYKPNKIFVSNPADANADHKAFYLFLQIALHDLENVIPKPKVYPYIIHAVGWPLPRHYHPELSLEPPRQFLSSEAEWHQFQLTNEQLEKKHQAILCYRSQTSSSAFYLLAFARKNELFGDYPEIELNRDTALKQGFAEKKLGLSNLFNESRDEETDDDTYVENDKGQVSYELQDNNLLIRIEKSKELNNRLSIQLYLFGYSQKTPFALMPKIRVITKHDKYRIFDARKTVNSQGVGLELNPDALNLKVPLRLLGDPDFILAAVKTYSGILQTDTTSFRKINIR
jgi:LmbE family N-acetylglucosaminyl deacetylase